MKVTTRDFQDRIKGFDWTTTKLADSLSAIGHETELVDNNTVDVTLTTNRPDCKDIDVLVYDFAGVYSLEFTGKVPDVGKNKEITITINDVNKILGTNLGQESLKNLARLGFEVTATSVSVPAYRSDIFEKADIAEEVARVYGFQNITPTKLPNSPLLPSSDYHKTLNLKLNLARIGLTETLTYTFVSQPSDWKLEHPYSEDEQYLRNSLLYGLLKTVAKNPFIKRGGFFEVGDIFKHEELEYVGVIIYGYKNKVREEMITLAEKALQCKEKIEVIAIDQVTLDKYDVSQSHVYFFEVPVAACETSTEAFKLNYELPVVKPISKFPPTVRDVSLISESREAANKKADSFVSKYLLFAELTDTFSKEDGTTSFTYRFFFQNIERNFTDAEIVAEIDQPLNKHFQ